MADAPVRTLAELEPGGHATVRRVPGRDRDLLRYLAGIGILPGASVELLSAEPFGGPLLVAAGGSQFVITRDLAALIGIS